MGLFKKADTHALENQAAKQAKAKAEKTLKQTKAIKSDKGRAGGSFYGGRSHN